MNLAKTFNFPFKVCNNIETTGFKCCILECGLIHFGLIHFGLIHFGLIHCGLIHCGLIHCGLIHCGLIHCGLIHWQLHCGLIHCGHCINSSICLVSFFLNLLVLISLQKHLIQF